MEHEHDKHESGGLFRSPLGLIVLGFLAIAGFFLLAEHRAHILAGNWGSALLLAAFIGLHFLMHAGHGGHGGHGGGCGGHRRPREESRPEKNGEKP